MVNHCSNSDCRAEFKVLREGDLYAYERRSNNTEFFWMCFACAAKFEMYLDPTGCVSIRLKTAVNRAQPPHPDGSLRLISHSIQPTHRTDTVPSGESAYSFVSIIERFSAAFRMRRSVES